MKVQSLWHEDSKTSKIREEHFQAYQDQLRLKSLYSFISLGTERLVARGEIPTSLQNVMQVPYMKGNFTFPVQYGYSLVGAIDQPGHRLHGSIVHLMHPHQDYCSISTDNFSVIPNSIPPKRAVLASNVETAINAIWDGEVSIGDRILVVGFGNIGALTALVARSIVGVEVYISEIDSYRIEQAQKLGFQIFQANNHPFDIAIHTSGTSEGLQLAIENVGFEGKVVELSWYGAREIALNLGASFHHERKQIISSQVGKIPSKKSNRWDYARRKELVWNILENPIFDQVLTNEILFSESALFFNEIRENLPKGLGFYISY